MKRKVQSHTVKTLTVAMYVQNVHHWHEHKHASVLAISQLRHQSATAPSLATHAADTVAAQNVMNVTVMAYLRYM